MRTRFGLSSGNSVELAVAPLRDGGIPGDRQCRARRNPASPRCAITCWMPASARFPKFLMESRLMSRVAPRHRRGALHRVLEAWVKLERVRRAAQTKRGGLDACPFNSMRSGSGSRTSSIAQRTGAYGARIYPSAPGERCGKTIAKAVMPGNTSITISPARAPIAGTKMASAASRTRRNGSVSGWRYGMARILFSRSALSVLSGNQGNSRRGCKRMLFLSRCHSFACLAPLSLQIPPIRFSLPAACRRKFTPVASGSAVRPDRYRRVFAGRRYWDVEVFYAKASPGGIAYPHPCQQPRTRRSDIMAAAAALVSQYLVVVGRIRRKTGPVCRARSSAIAYCRLPATGHQHR